jgi:hypothetical protein
VERLLGGAACRRGNVRHIPAPRYKLHDDGPFVLCTLATLIAVVGPAVAQVPSALVHSIPPPPVGVQIGAKLGFSVAVGEDYSWQVRLMTTPERAMRA